MTPTSKRSATTRNGFTTLELIAVLSIIAILLALIFPASRMIQEHARRKQAFVQAQALAQATKLYRQEYGRWPGQASFDPARPISEFGEGLLFDLTNNPRAIAFIDLESASVLGHKVVDPWQRPFCISMDEDGDGRTHLTGLGSLDETINDTVAVLSTGPDPQNTNKYIFSWRP